MLQRALPTVLALLVALTALPAAAAEGLVQLRLEGAIRALESTPVEGEEAPPEPEHGTGHLIEVEIGALVQREERAVVLHLHVAEGTTGAELAKLISTRLGRAKISAEATLAGDSAGSIWVDNATYVNVRAGGGIKATIACVAGPPARVVVHGPSAIPAPATMAVAASTAVLVKDRPPIRRRSVLEAKLDPKDNPATSATALWTAASAREWVSHRPGAQAWSPTGMVNGAEITGLSLSFGNSVGDWRVEVEL